MKRWLLLLCFVPSVAFAARLEDVTVLDAKTGPDSVELKLHSKDGPPGSYFFLDIIKSDPGAFEKLAHVIRKLMARDAYRLDLDIPSFSVSPSGSRYRSEGIGFHSPSHGAGSGSQKR
jgi:hypothetical protein